MPRPRKVPAVLVEATVSANAKLASLPNDTARLGYFYVVLGKAKLAEPMPGQFASRGLFDEVAGRFARYLRDYLAVGLLEEAPRLCDRCRERWSPIVPVKGALVVHDWHEHQYDPRKIERQREYEDRQRAGQSEAVSDAVSDGQSDVVSDAVSDEFPTGDSRGGARPHVAGTSRARRDRAPNVERRTENVEKVPLKPRTRGRNGAGPTLSKAQLTAWSDFGAEWDAFRQAWIGRGLLLPPTGSATDDEGESQRSVLYSILAERPRDLVRWVSEAPGKTGRDVVAHVLERWHGVRVEAGDDEPAAWMASGPDRAEAAETVGAILKRLGSDG